ncbi:hypothetical protein HKBW3S03_00268 [Candidatus Hakubella thermalkaliphila]|uniref:TIGR01906 family membrane protein n=2 Tax=Candidatus Hakubella thermalkaliphila TaxID=2754717 RepID=A0A6V8PWQ0_9ACTN|nr:hypothetical protein HKBW3S03_00268 [Candidatus Hakubella thermalkaliphila]GFP37009.1 hypothetical protein HKBW3S44_00690 [Candidatus Hakubella thermalkaliphila]GFP41584.1 hypothetical protein HKBW3C_00709 [Candidatus Hakubella thermalkaliphila]
MGYVMRTLQAGLGIIFVLCLPILLLTSGIRVAVNEIRLYEYGFDKYEISLLRPVDRAELAEIARELIVYFNSEDELIGDRLRQVFPTRREIIHLWEVKRLIQLSYRVQEIALVYTFAYLALGFACLRKAFLPKLAKAVLGGSVTTIVLPLILGGLALFAFNWFWWKFHVISFPGSDYWILDPEKHNLLRMFPQGFWFDATMLVTGGVAVAALMMGGGAGAYLVVRQRRDRPIEGQ